MHVLSVKNIYLCYVHKWKIEIAFEINIAICHYQQFVVPYFPFWYFLCDPDIKMQKLRSERVYKRNEYIVDKKTYWRRENYYFKGLYKTTCYKTKSNFSQFCYSHWLLHEGFFSFLIKVFVKSEKSKEVAP